MKVTFSYTTSTGINRSGSGKVIAETYVGIADAYVIQQDDGQVVHVKKGNCQKAV